MKLSLKWTIYNELMGECRKYMSISNYGSETAFLGRAGCEWS